MNLDNNLLMKLVSYSIQTYNDNVHDNLKGLKDNGRIVLDRINLYTFLHCMQSHSLQLPNNLYQSYVNTRNIDNISTTPTEIAVKLEVQKMSLTELDHLVMSSLSFIDKTFKSDNINTDVSSVTRK